MKKGIWLLLIALLLTGCGTSEVMETVSDEHVQEVLAPVREILVELPDEAAVPAVEGDSGQIYLCRDYEITLQTLDGGDLNATIESLSGYERDKLTVISSEARGIKRYDFVWFTAGERGDRLGRAVILDDGNYHYTMTVLRDADTTENSQVVWRTVFESFSLL